MKVHSFRAYSLFQFKYRNKNLNWTAPYTGQLRIGSDGKTLSSLARSLARRAYARARARGVSERALGG